jgi:prepilin-type N-terminal cleavage/methylation domain-containing protein/prepilin-type processing-associated H-X9-DG protein
MKTPDAPVSSRAGAFTLIELLVVIAIVSILAGLLLPALTRAKVKAQGVICMSQHRQLLLAWQLYAEDSDQKLPGAGRGQIVDGRRLPSWMGDHWESLDFRGDDNNWDAQKHLPQCLLWPYCGQARGIFKCPADRSHGTRGAERLARIRSVSMNNWVGGPAWAASGPDWKVYRRLADLTDPGPSSTWVVLDERQDSIDDGCFDVDMKGFPGDPALGRLVDIPANYHDNACSFAFADGHTELKRWRDARTMPPVKKTNLHYLTERNLPAPGSPDLRWLQERSTRPASGS